MSGRSSTERPPQVTTVAGTVTANPTPNTHEPKREDTRSVYYGPASRPQESCWGRRVAAHFGDLAVELPMRHSVWDTRLTRLVPQLAARSVIASPSPCCEQPSFQSPHVPILECVRIVHGSRSRVARSFMDMRGGQPGRSVSAIAWPSGRGCACAAAARDSLRRSWKSDQRS